jgi:seryl-tRNA synthetase
MVFKSFPKKDKIMSKDGKKDKVKETSREALIRDINSMRAEIEKRLEEIGEQYKTQTIEAESKIKEQKLKLPIGKELDNWIIKKHEEKREALDAINLKEGYHVDFGRYPDMFDLTASYRKLIKKGKFIVVGMKTLYKESG